MPQTNGQVEEKNKTLTMEHYYSIYIGSLGLLEKALRPR
jgi:hypothetical protein